MKGFHTSFIYHNREDRAKYIWLKYKTILQGRILDVGADKGYLGSYLPSECQYTTVGLEPEHDVHVDLENPLPIDSNAYDCVLCSGVLEHIENIHQLFDELCRVTRKYLIIMLPNPWNDFIKVLRKGYYSRNDSMGDYNLPLSPPTDRHRWFFSSTDAKRFIRAKARENEVRVLQLDQLMSRRRWRIVCKFLCHFFVHRSIKYEDLAGWQIWGVLEKKPFNSVSDKAD